MSSALRFSFPLTGGMHARPASALEQVARRFAADVSIANERSGQAANAKSVLGIIGLEIRHGDACRLAATGPDAESALESLAAFVELTLPHVDDAAAPAETAAKALLLPPVLRRERTATIAGTPVVPGIGIGRVVALGARAVPDSLPRMRTGESAVEVQKVEEALQRLLRRYDGRLEAASRSVEDDLLRAHRSIARDPEFAGAIVRGVRERALTAAGAIADAEKEFAEMLAATGSAILRERALDIRDVCRALLREVYGDALPADEVALGADSICAADTLTPAQLLALDREKVKGLVLSHAGTTSHTVILARSRGIPTLVGVEGLDAAALDGSEVIVDADLGAVVTRLTPGVRRYYDMERHRIRRRQARVRAFIERPAATIEGRRLEVGANVGSAAEVADAVAGGADGIGLFRTELLFLARPTPPSEDEQFEEYRRAVTDAAGRPVIIRTLDVGGDKPLPYLALPKEENPFLGCRGVRVYPEYESLFRAQVRALVRASAFGRLQVMIPMISRVEESAWVRRVFDEEQAALEATGVKVDRRMPLGAMIEVPAAALMIGQLSRALDFFSIGTNDLMQYFAAADRTNPRLAGVADPLEPSFLRLLHQVVTDAHAAERWVGLCGEMGGQARCLPLLVGLGLDEISLAAPDIAATRGSVADLSAAACAALVERAMRASTSREVGQMLDERGHWRELPMTSPGLVDLDADCLTKEEAIKAAVDLLYAAGRTDRPREIEDAVWRREETYSTGFGHGFAIPHCRTDAAGASSMAVVKLRSGVDWNALDGQPVRTVILLVVREGEDAAAHMRVLASLARRLMHEEFRSEIEREQDPVALCELLWKP